jgi:preprotein translocase subunit SecD
VTERTRETATTVLQDRINQGGLTGGSVSTVGSTTGTQFVVVEVPNANRSEVLDLIGRPGRVQIVATYPVETANGTESRRTPVLTQGDFAGIQPARQAQEGNPPNVPVTLNDQAAVNFTNAMQEFGFTGPGVNACNQAAAYSGTGDPGYCLLTVVDGETVFAADMSADLASDFVATDGEPAFLARPEFQMTTGNFSEAQDLRLNLVSGALPTELDIQSELFLAPSLAQQFKPLALLTGLVAWLAVTGVIFYRYREAKVAVPMLATAAAEVFILLGFAAAVGLALDLSHIAGFIAVIGTGVDDLVIIADEILQRGDVATGRVFQSRFRKAFWVIGAAAATTIIAMSPLAVLSLGDLQGFAIVTIVGVLIGVLVTRPAYGNILRNFLLEE